MKANVAVATVSGKAYYLLVNELRRRNIPFLSLTPNEPIPIEIKAVITTEKEKHLINHQRIMVYQDEVGSEALINEILLIIQGKGQCERIVVGVDPGDVFGLAVLADGKVIETANCFSANETMDKIMSVMKTYQKIPQSSISVKIGDGVPSRKEELLRGLDEILPHDVMLESVSETGTSRYLKDAKHRRGLRDIASAIRIAGRNGRTYQRRRNDESNS